MEKGNKALTEALREAAQAGEMKSPISLLTTPTYQLWAELADEAFVYVTLLSLLWDIDINSSMENHIDTEERKKLEGDLLKSLSHIQAHSQVLNESVIDALDLADQLEERELLKTP